MREKFFENPVEIRTALSSPQFDDRRVVQRAQRVVPLAEIRTRRRNRRLWFLGGAFTLAMMLGAASALLAVRIKQQPAASQVTQLTVETPTEDSLPATETAAAIPPETDTAAPAGDDQAPPLVAAAETTRKQPAAVAQRPRVVERDREVLGPRPDEVQPTEEEQLQQIRDAVLYDQWQERRMRRAARRERRNRNDRDLSHVDELFEGPRRPDRP